MSSLRVHLFLSGFAIATLLPISVLGQVGNDNPTGPSGQFNGNVTTADSYDPYTGNAKRTVTDIVVTGGVGAYPLAFRRTSNSRADIIPDFQFGPSGNWRHSYSWEADPSPVDDVTYFSVHFPDGRWLTFFPSASDDFWRAGPGVPERLDPSSPTLILPDGGKVAFSATRHWLDGGAHSYYTYKATAIIDPHGLGTTLTYYPDGSLNTIREPAGRTLQLFYLTTPWVVNSLGGHDRVIDRVQASDGRIVQYSYGATGFTSYGGYPYTYLGNVVYPSDPGLPSPTALYTYQPSNLPPPYYLSDPPLLSSCDDPMYEGPMKRIGYVYATTNDDGSAVVAGQIRSENYFDGVNIGGAVSTLTINSATQRAETRGDGPSRIFNYSGGKLAAYTDFKGYTSSIGYDGNGYVWSFTDARLHTTTTLREGIIGAISVLTHPDPEQSTQRFDYKYADGAPYFIQIRGDERNFNSNTYFTRPDATNRVTKIWYPDYPNGPTEEFSYTGFGQIETHTMTSGGVENFRYDGRGLKYLSWPPPTPSDPNPEQHPTRYFYYTSGPQMDRLRQVVDPRGYSTSFEYNVRGQVTKVTHDQDQSYAQFGYNLDGTLAWTADENHPNASWNVNERTRYIYDDYKRVISVTNPMNETTTFSYAPLNGTGSYSHTTSSIFRATSPLNKITTFDYDENFCRKMVRRAAESSDDDGGTWFGYDEAGNLTSVQDPRGNVTTFEYDERNRRIKATAPAPFNAQITKWEYDTRSNLTKETQPDLLFRRMEYDPMSRVIDAYGFANEHTHYERDHAGNVLQMTDPKPGGAGTYFFGYDKMNRKTSATYPLDATQTVRGEGWHYDLAGNMDQYTNPAGQVKTLGYDTRNRLYSSSWNSGSGPTVGLGYYGNSQLGIIVTYNPVTNNEDTRVVFGYNAADRQIWEEQTVAGFPTRRVETPRDNDGFRSSLNAPGAYTVSYDYSKRGELKNIYGSGSVLWFSYGYDLAGNMIKRQDVLGGVNDSTNVVDSVGASQYDQLNRPMMWEQTGIGNAAFARSHFKYDNLGRLTAQWRDEQSSKGEWFGYDPAGQLKDVSYNADGVSIGAPQNANRTVSYTMTPDTLNRLGMNDSGDQSDYVPNALNQYQSVAGGDIYYDDKFNLMWTGGFSAGFDSENHLTAIGSGEDWGQFTYDGLGRCLKRTVDWETTLITYDGWQPIVEWDEWNNLKAWNVYGTGPDEILYRHDAARGDLRYHLDRMGNVAFILDSDGDGVERYTYDVFGHPAVTDWNGDNPRTWSAYGNRFMFAGREYFPELGLYEFRNRFYYPAIGRFVQSDPTGFDAGDANLFRYCGHDPVNSSDPFGLGNGIVDFDPYDGKPVYGDPVNEPREPWSVFGPLNDYFNSLFSDDKSRLETNPEPGQALLATSNSQEQNQPGKPDYAIRAIQRKYPTKEGNIYYAKIFWKITLFHHNQKHLGPGIQFGENIRFSEGVGFTAKDWLRGGWPTRDDGSVDDPWILPFDRPDGHVMVTQTIFAGGREATWQAIVYANSDYDAQQYIPFQ
jgi:RHS repeat-associated protein